MQITPSSMNKNRPEIPCESALSENVNNVQKRRLHYLNIKNNNQEKGLRNKGGEKTQMLAPKDQNSLDRTSHSFADRKR